MVYCEKCKLLSETAPCRACGSSRVSIPAPTNYCFLTELEYMWASMLEEALKDNGIPAVSMADLDRAIILRPGGEMHQKHRLFVPFGHWEEADEIRAALFDEPVFEE